MAESSLHFERLEADTLRKTLLEVAHPIESETPTKSSIHAIQSNEEGGVRNSSDSSSTMRLFDGDGEDERMGVLYIEYILLCVIFQ